MPKIGNVRGRRNQTQNPNCSNPPPTRRNDWAHKYEAQIVLNGLAAHISKVNSSYTSLPSPSSSILFFNFKNVFLSMVESVVSSS